MNKVWAVWEIGHDEVPCSCLVSNHEHMAGSQTTCTLPIFFTVAPRPRPPAKTPAFERARAPFGSRPARRWLSRRSDVKGRGGFYFVGIRRKNAENTCLVTPGKTLYLVTPHTWQQLVTTGNTEKENHAWKTAAATGRAGPAATEAAHTRPRKRHQRVTGKKTPLISDVHYE